jgi:TolB-like protein/DNA-binding winged helix-turn-helix (wHTH) protein/Tfp pilus assembly protein PilF
MVRASTLKVGECVIDPGVDEVSRDGTTIKLEPRAMRVLMHLVHHAGEVVSVQELLDTVWADVVVTQDSVYTAIAALRRALGDDSREPRYIANVPRRGYRLVAPVTPDSGPASETPQPELSAAPVVAQAGHAGASSGHRPMWSLVAAAVAALAALAYLVVAKPWAARPAPHAPAAAVSADRAARDLSIAVLPFANLSADREQEYFADGISEELLSLLTKFPQLRVISRSSAFSFKGQNLAVAEIAKRLNVGLVLEGSVRQAGTEVRITAQLIDARADRQLWSETYDRPLVNIFALQDEIAAAVVSQLKLKLLGAASTTKAPDPRAYAAVLQARQVALQRTAAGYERAIALFRQALGTDPGYSAAWVGLARVYVNQANDGLRPIDESYRLARQAVDQALTLDPEYAPAHAMLGRLAMTHDGDLAIAAQHYEHALALEPANTDIVRSAAMLAASLGRLEASVALGQFVVARDPVNPTGYLNLGYDYFNAGRLDEAIASLHTALTLSPNHAAAEYGIAVALLMKGEPTAALAAMQRESSAYWRAVGLPMVFHALGRKAESDAALARLIEEHRTDAAYNIAYVHAFRGEANRAFEWLDKAATDRDPGLDDIAVDPLFAGLYHDRRWPRFLRRLGKSPEQLAAIRFDVQLAK